MLRIGYTLSSEEFDPITLTRLGQMAEDEGFSFLGVSDHFHPWIDKQGQSPFVWNVIGALSQVTKTANVFMGVNCPIIRYHPAIIAQAAATSQYQLQGRFVLGVGTGENLNEHIVGAGWPPIHIRQEMLTEAIFIMRLLWEGGYKSFKGDYYHIDAARIYTLPKNPIPIIISGMGSKSALLAAELGDGLVTTVPDEKLITIFERNGGRDKPKYAQMTVCFDQSSDRAKEILKKTWPLSGIPKPLNTELRLPRDFESTSKLVRIEDVSKNVPTGADTEAILQAMQKYIDTGFDHIYIHNIGPNQEQFIKFFSKEILPKFKQQVRNRSSEGLNHPQTHLIP